MIAVQTLASSSRGNAYIVSDGVAPVLLDPGIPYRAIQERCGFTAHSLVGALVSHEHQDHCRAVRALLKAGIDCYASGGTQRGMKLGEHHRLHTIRGSDVFKLGPWTVLPFDTQHDANEPLGFLLQQKPYRIVYLADSYYCRYRFEGLTHILIEANYDTEILRRRFIGDATTLAHKKRVMRSHLSIDNALRWLLQNDLSNVEEIHLLHLSDDNSDADAFRERVMKATGRPTYVAGERGGEEDVR